MSSTSAPNRRSFLARSAAVAAVPAVAGRLHARCRPGPAGYAGRRAGLACAAPRRGGAACPASQRPLRTRAPQMTAPPAKIPAVHQNAVV